jgi:hypothetical protein
LRADSGFWNTKIMARLQAAGWTYSIGVRQQQHIKAAIKQSPSRTGGRSRTIPKLGRRRSPRRCSVASG